MSVYKEEIQKLLENAPESKLKLIKEYAEKLINERDKFEDAFDFAIDNYNEALKGLKDR